MQSLLLLITNLWLVFVSIKVVKKNTFIYFKMENMFESFMYCKVLVLFLITKKRTDGVVIKGTV